MPFIVSRCVCYIALLLKLPSMDCSRDYMNASDKRIKVVINGDYSDFMSVNAGVLQGSVLSLALFLLHINDMVHITGIHYYLDNTSDT